MLSKKIIDFVNAEKEVLMTKGWNLWGCLTQAWHETAGFKKVIGENNYWGIKKPSKWDGKIHRLWTTEISRRLELETNDVALKRLKRVWDTEDLRIDGLSIDMQWWIIKLPQDFIDWNTPVQAVEWWLGLMNRLYKGCVVEKKNPIGFFEALVSGQYKWATDIGYVAKLKTLYPILKNNIELCKIVEVKKIYDKDGKKYN